MVHIDTCMVDLEPCSDHSHHRPPRVAEYQRSNGRNIKWGGSSCPCHPTSVGHACVYPNHCSSILRIVHIVRVVSHASAHVPYLESM